MQHVSLMQEAGGIVNGSTRFDYTNYFQSLPSNGLERALLLEAEAAAPVETGASSYSSDSGPSGTLADDEALAALREKLSGR